MGTKSNKPKAKKQPVTVVTTPLILATQAVMRNLENAQRRFDRLTPEQQRLPVNAASMEALKRKVRSVDVVRKLIVNDVCCDLQVQNCDFDIEE